MTTQQENWFWVAFTIICASLIAYLVVTAVHDDKLRAHATQLCQDRGGVYTHQGCFPGTQRIRIDGS